MSVRSPRPCAASGMGNRTEFLSWRPDWVMRSGRKRAPRPDSAYVPIPGQLSLKKAGEISTHVSCIRIMSSLPLFHLSLKTITESRQSKDSYPHFTEKKTEAQRGEMTYPAVKGTRARTQIFWPQAQCSSLRSLRLGGGYGQPVCLCDHTAATRLPEQASLSTCGHMRLRPAFGHSVS